MIPTNELRFVERIERVRAAVGNIHIVKTVQVLQQKWVGNKYYSNGKFIPAVDEWRDVPLVKEQNDN